MTCELMYRYDLATIRVDGRGEDLGLLYGLETYGYGILEMGWLLFHMYLATGNIQHGAILTDNSIPGVNVYKQLGDTSDA